MRPRSPYRFKIASEAWEFEQIHELNYRTFVEEIPQHPVNPRAALVDKFDHENTYLIALHDRTLIGMMAVRANRPFSLDQKLPDLDEHLPDGRIPCELRLLAVEPKNRSGNVLLGLMALLDRYCAEHGFDLALISGTTRQEKLYRRLGFTPFGPLVGAGDALFQPMYLTLEAAEKRAKPLLHLRGGRVPERLVVNLLPGPVAMTPAVRAAFAAPAESHRSPAFVATIDKVRRRLSDMVGAPFVAILPGSGTLANDAIAGQLALSEGRGLILSNGEFGERLVDHAHRAGLAFETVRAEWGEPFAPDEIAQALDRAPTYAWLWTVLCETSTGVLHDLPALKSICSARDVRLCLDAISAIGSVPINLSGVALASGTSGKGLAAYPGLALVFADHCPAPAPHRLPRSLDLGVYASGEGVPYTLSSNLVHALEAALAPLTDPAARHDRFATITGLASWLRWELRVRGAAIVAPDAHASPAVTTVALPSTVSSSELADRLEAAGFLIASRSRYLQERNWIQLCLMGDLGALGGSACLARIRLSRLLDLVGDLLQSAQKSPPKSPPPKSPPPKSLPPKSPPASNPASPLS